MRITSFRPVSDEKRGTVVTVTVIARSVDDVQQFMDNLEQTGVFPEILPPAERINEEGQLETTLEAVYTPRVAAVPAAEGRKP